MMRDADFEASQSKLTQALTENINKNKPLVGCFFFFAGCHVLLFANFRGNITSHVTADVNGKAVRHDGSSDSGKQL